MEARHYCRAFLPSSDNGGSSMDFYDQQGCPVAYLADAEHIHDWDGRPSAFVRNGNVYDYSGRHIGWLQDGWIRASNGDALLFSADAIGGPLKPLRDVPSVKGVRGIRPVKGVAQVPPVKPVFGFDWSNEAWGVR